MLVKLKSSSVTNWTRKIDMQHIVGQKEEDEETTTTTTTTKAEGKNC